MPEIPRDKSLESTLALMADPYRFISKRCQEFGTDLFETRLMLRRVICMTGAEAAELFYDPQRFIRKGATPGRIEKTLFGRGGVQGTDDEEHRHRKEMFLSLMTPDRIQEFGRLVDQWWQMYAERWTSMEEVVLYDEVQEILTRAVCAWAGVPLGENEVSKRTRQLTALFDMASSIGPKHWWARLARWRADRWITDVISKVRSRELQPPEQSAAHVIAWHHDHAGNMLSPGIAAVELINVLRPTVAIAVFVTFLAHALHQYPESRRKLLAEEHGYADQFVQEVRRFYPFFPAVAARVRQDFDWHGYHFPHGLTVMLDLYGTNHDPRAWANPDEFQPERFQHWDGSPFNFIPQGGGDHATGHRCPGEWITLEVMKRSLDQLVQRLQYDVPAQDLRLDMTRLPALPASRFIIRNVTVQEPQVHAELAANT